MNENEKENEPNRKINISFFFVPVCGSLIIWRYQLWGHGGTKTFLFGLFLVAIFLSLGNGEGPPARVILSARKSLWLGLLCSLFLLSIWVYLEITRARYPFNPENFLSWLN